MPRPHVNLDTASPPYSLRTAARLIGCDRRWLSGVIAGRLGTAVKPIARFATAIDEPTYNWAREQFRNRQGRRPNG